MNRSDLRHLMSVRGYPAVSVLCRTHRTFPDNRQDPIRLKNLLAEAGERLLAEFSKREAKPLIDRLDALAGNIDHNHNLDGLALFVNPESSEWLRVPFPVEDRVVIDETFATRDLLYALNRSEPYRVLFVSDGGSRLFEGVRDELAEVSTGGFPVTFERLATDNPPQSDRGTKEGAAEEWRKRVFRDVDRALGDFQSNDALPIVLVADVRPAAVFSQLTRLADWIVGTIPVPADIMTPHELGKRTWPVVQAHSARRKEEALEELDHAVGAGRFVSTVEGVWRNVHDGRGATLLVEEGFRYPARLADDGRTIVPAEDVTAPDVIDDAIDEVIETLVAQGGRAVVVPDGALAEHSRLSLVLRY